MKFFPSALVASALVLALPPAAALAQGSPAGDWELTITTPQDTNVVNLSLQLEGEKITGNLSGRMGSVPVTGTAVSGALALIAELAFQGASVKLAVDGKMDGEALNGTVKFGDFGEFPFTGKRVEKTAAAPGVPAAPAAPAGGAGSALTGASGKWNVVILIPGGGEMPASATLTQDDQGIVGGVISSPAGEVVVSGTMTGTSLKLEFKATTPQGEIPIVMTGDLTDAGLAGKATIVGLGEADWKATRAP